MRFSLRSLLVLFTATTVLVGLNLRVSPQIEEFGLFPHPSGMSDFLAIRGWPLQPWKFGIYGAGGDIKSMPNVAGVVALNAIIAVGICIVACLCNSLLARAVRRLSNQPGTPGQNGDRSR
ncbi:hypothetical protein Pla175_50360 [Pirellulimonas nuda]|uniref:Uncharacterized protein n=1 Tax=Pirellulimonas nuda TaxID=2528009 RepID=A0A518DJI6_9BACT|nr:hypothetical protein [Pirellulimonas nuda]QDU91606.1 hypothetical protein Pla175_50360 [Pirellulimonas nuda]